MELDFGLIDRRARSSHMVREAGLEHSAEVEATPMGVLAAAVDEAPGDGCEMLERQPNFSSCF